MELSYLKNLKRDLKGKKILWVAEDFDNDQFRNFILKINSKFENGNIIYNDRNILVNFQAEEINGLKKILLLINLV